MALVPCRECGVDVSEEAQKCPHCGVALRKPKETLGIYAGVNLGITCLFINGFLYYFFEEYYPILNIAGAGFFALAYFIYKTHNKRIE